jgi:hypothetical protein
MKRKQLHVLLLAAGIGAANLASAQLFIDQATFTIQPGATVTVQGDVTSNVDIQGTGKVILKGSANQNVNMNGFTVPNLEVDNTSNVTLTGAAKVSGVLTFTNGDILLGNNNLTLTSAATVTGSGSSKYVVTNGTGRLIKQALATTAFTYPVGKATTSYTPLTVANSGTADDIGVRVFNGVYTGGGTTGTAFTKEVVNNTWDVSEATAGGSNLTMSASWNAADTLLGFDRTRTGISYYIPTAGATQGWDLLNSQVGVSTGAGPFTSVQRTGLTGVGSFAIGTRPVLSALLVTPKVFLQGNYNSTSGVMNDTLRKKDLIPLIEPYSALTGMLSNNNTVRGSGGGETTTAAVAGNAAGVSTNNSIVDWVLVQLHNAAGTVITQRAALLQRDGDIVDVDGTSSLNLAGNAAGTYYISVKHRNHLGIRTTATFALAKTTASPYNFTTALAQAFKGTVTNNQMATLNTGATVFGMWSGNANDDIKTTMSGLGPVANDYSKLLNTLGKSTNTLLNVYSKQDLNMDGKVTMSGLGPNVNDYSKLLNTLGKSTVTVIQPTF